MILDIAKVSIPLALAFVVGFALAPILSHFLYKYKMWKKAPRTVGLDGGATPIFTALHKDKEVNTPRMGGVIIWTTTLIVSLAMWALSEYFPGPITGKLNFISRDQTWLPLFTLVAASIIGLIDDFLVIQGRGGYIAGGIPLFMRIGLVLLLGLIGGYWFAFKLEMSTIMLPFYGPVYLDGLFIPFFMLVMLALFSGGVIDGVDGLSGGVMAAIFAAYGSIAFYQEQINLATFCAVVVGGILAFLWFNIPPARFYMSETGILGLTTTITVIAFLTDSVLLLPIIAFPLFLTSGSVIIQVLSKRFRGKKVFLSAPFHHHLEALGWPNYKVAMRFWVVSIIFAVVGVILSVLSNNF